MTFEEFQSTLHEPTASASLAPALRALWHDARGEWDEAHRVAQDIDDESGARVHAYLHRKEGDLANASYWYRRARQPVARDSLTAEWERIVRALIGSNI